VSQGAARDEESGDVEARSTTTNPEIREPERSRDDLVRGKIYVDPEMETMMAEASCPTPNPKGVTPI